MNRLERRAHAKRMSKLPAKLELVPPSLWPTSQHDLSRLEVWQSRDYLVQVFFAPNGYRISVNRTTKLPDGRWADGLTWDELQQIKSAVGFKMKQAIEIYPPADKVVNVANMRHLWVMQEPLEVGW